MSEESEKVRPRESKGEKKEKKQPPTSEEMDRLEHEEQQA